ncbi:MAG: hypothetical protein ABSC94_28200 [Polyangiaceae bacterium]
MVRHLCLVSPFRPGLRHEPREARERRSPGADREAPGRPSLEALSTLLAQPSANVHTGTEALSIGGMKVASGPIPDVTHAAHELGSIGVRGTFSP